MEEFYDKDDSEESETDESLYTNYERDVTYQERLEKAIEYYKRLKFYCDFHNLNLLRKNPDYFIGKLIDV